MNKCQKTNRDSDVDLGSSRPLTEAALRKQNRDVNKQIARRFKIAKAMIPATGLMHKRQKCKKLE